MSILESDSLPPAEELAPGTANTMFRNRIRRQSRMETNFKS
jgi:hypothetical protein